MKDIFHKLLLLAKQEELRNHTVGTEVAYGISDVGIATLSSTIVDGGYVFNFTLEVDDVKITSVTTCKHGLMLTPGTVVNCSFGEGSYTATPDGECVVFIGPGYTPKETRLFSAMFDTVESTAIAIRKALANKVVAIMERLPPPTERPIGGLIVE